MMTPRIAGTVTVRSSADAFLRAFHQRVAAGLLSGHPHARSNYRVVHAGPGELRVRAVDWWTAANVGLNDVELRVERPGAVRYDVTYWRWASYAVGLGGILGAIGLALLLTVDVRGYIDRHSAEWLSGLTTEQHLVFAWAMVLFWGFAWPWLLVALHKRPLRRLVERVVSEVDAAAAGSPDAGR